MSDPDAVRDAGAAPRRGRSVRTRVLAAMMAFMFAGLAIAGGVTHSLLFAQMTERVHADLAQEVDELRLLAAEGMDDGQPFTDVTSLLRRATASAVPGQHESVLALTDGEPRFRPQDQTFDLSSPEILEQILQRYERGRTVFFTAHSPTNGELRIVVASVLIDGDPTEGMFVVANAYEQQRAGIWASAGNYAAVSLLTLAVAGGAAWLITGRLLRPVEDLREASSQITVDDLNRRVPVPDTDDDVAALASNFNRMLDRINEGYQGQKQFLRDVGHELRTPITIVRGTVEMMDPDDRADFDESRAIALEELDRTARLVGELSELAQSGQPDFLRPGPVNLERFGHDAVARLTHLEEDRQWQLRDAVPVEIWADEQRLMQAVVQLGANAVRYSDPGTPIELSVRARSSRTGSEVAIAVRDDGVGIAPEDQARIFDRFVQLDRGRAGGGSGLGLSIVQAIAEAHGGRVEVESTLGHGSTFTLVLQQGHWGEPADPTDRDHHDRDHNDWETDAHSDR